MFEQTSIMELLELPLHRFCILDLLLHLEHVLLELLDSGELLNDLGLAQLLIPLFNPLIECF